MMPRKSRSGLMGSPAGGLEQPARTATKNSANRMFVCYHSAARSETIGVGTMGDETVLKGVFKDGGLVASVIQKPDIARILVKGAEPGPDFKESVRKVADGCKAHVEKFGERELCAVLVANPGQAESIDFTQEEIGGYGLTKITAMDGTCGIVVRVLEA